jgi:hypothetical protein
VLEPAGGGHVRPTAKVFEATFPIQTHVFAGGNTADDLGLVVLAHGLEMDHSLITGQHAAHDGFVLLGEFAHALFDGLEVLGGEGAFVGKVVIETVLDDRPDGDLRLGEEFLDGIGQQVRGGMANHLQTIRIPLGDDRQRRIRFDAVAGIHQTRRLASPDPATQCRLGQPSANGSRHLGHRQRLGKLTTGTVRQGDGDHGNTPKLKRKNAAKAALKVTITVIRDRASRRSRA